MSVFDRRPRLRWAVPAAAGTLILAGTLIGTVGVSADSGLPARTAQELLVDLQAPKATALSGTVVTKADLGLPDLPMGMASSTGLTSLMSGTNTLRVWTTGPEQTRVALIDTADEFDVIHTGRDVWVWSSSGKTAEHYVLPGRDTSAAPGAGLDPMNLPSTPREAADLVLKALNDTTDVSTTGVASVAGRAVYELILTPRQSDTLVARVVIAIDAQTSTPLRVQVFSTVMPDPAYEVGFTAVDFSVPDASVFAFTPPPGATVTEHADAAAGSAPDESAEAPVESGAKPTVVGTGWSQVVVATLPADQFATLAGGAQDGDSGDGASSDALALLQSLPRTAGAWGSGRILSGTLVSVILTDDGRIAIGAVAPDTLGAALAAPVTDAVTTIGLTKRFGSQAAVDGIDMVVPYGAVYGFLGPNGSGKTTTIRMLLGLVRPTAGTVEVLGAPIPGGSSGVLPRVGSLVEGPAFHPYLSGRANLARLDAADRFADPGTSRARIDAALERVGLLAAARKRYRAYSLGMRQRLAIAAALLAPRDLLVLDEPTNGLDPQGTREVRSLIASLAGDGATVLVSSHLLSEVEQVCSHLGVMRQGRLVAQGTIGDVRAGSRPVVVVTTGMPEQAATVLRDLGMADVAVTATGARAASAALEPERIVEALVHAGVGIKGFAVQSPSLEDLFVSLTGEGFDVGN